MADLPLPMQVKLLRAIQERRCSRLAASRSRPSTYASVCDAQDLAQVEEGNFRQDLYYRLNVIELPVPSLRERTEDIPELADEIPEAADEYGTPRRRSPTTRSRRCVAIVPGNVRELENVLERAFTLCENKRIRASDLNLSAGRSVAPRSIPAPMESDGALEPPLSSPRGIERCTTRPDSRWKTSSRGSNDGDHRCA